MILRSIKYIQITKKNAGTRGTILKDIQVVGYTSTHNHSLPFIELLAFIKVFNLGIVGHTKSNQEVFRIKAMQLKLIEET